MEDKRIIDLFFARSERAVQELSGKYGKLCLTIAYRILGNWEDSRECENDTYLRVWNSVPPTVPRKLSAYVSKITHNLALSRLVYDKRKKRSPEVVILLSELEECIPGADDVEMSADDTVACAITAFLEQEKEENRALFLRRYFYGEDIKELARKFGLNPSNVSTRLNRMRARLREYLEKEEIWI